MALALAYYSHARFIVNLLPLPFVVSSPCSRAVKKAHSTPTTSRMEDPYSWCARPCQHARHLVPGSHCKESPGRQFHPQDGLGLGYYRRRDALKDRLLDYRALHQHSQSGLRRAALVSRHERKVPGEEVASGIPLPDGVAVARRTNGETGSGVYSVDWDGESARPKVERLLAQYRKAGMVEQVWRHNEEEFNRITGLGVPSSNRCGASIIDYRDNRASGVRSSSLGVQDLGQPVDCVLLGHNGGRGL